ncbi:MAG: hypothetical protein JSV58_07095 [Candidatus Bathyarchaeota archaeon]|nr:MAG: hypothetical protein JSV58_07095 [Candidatus Bathyarchaeota archaeon]
MTRQNVALTMTFIVAGLLVIIVLLNSTVMGTLLGRVTLPNQGIVKTMGVGVYWDSGCSNQVTSIDWGAVAPGSINDVAVYVKNEGNTVATLSATTENWSPPSTSTYMSLSWDYAGQPVAIGEVVQVVLSLSVSQVIEGITGFSFDIVIIGSN